MTNSASAKLISLEQLMLWRVHRRTVNPSPRGKHSWFDSKLLHHFRLVSIMVITADCLSAYGSSILPRVASFVNAVYSDRVTSLELRL